MLSLRKRICQFVTPRRLTDRNWRTLATAATSTTIYRTPRLYNKRIIPGAVCGAAFDDLRLLSTSVSASAAAAAVASSTPTTPNLSLLRQTSSFQLDDSTGLLQYKPKSRSNHQQQENRPARFQIIVGLEIHAQLDIPTKLFSPAAATTHAAAAALASKLSSSSSSSSSSSLKQHQHLQKPNLAIRSIRSPAANNDSSSHNSEATQNLPPLVHPLDVAVPGYLPVLSKEAVQKTVLAAALFQCQIQKTSRFERKHYTYADLPSHYQITQQRWPLAVNGQVRATVVLPNKEQYQSNRSKTKKQQEQQSSSSPKEREVTCRIERIQLEQDTGKTIIQQLQQQQTRKDGGTTTVSLSCVDFNRAGQALMEIVLAPDLRTPLEASSVTETIRQLLKHAGVCDGRMEEGSFRCDVNVNIQEEEQQQQQYSEDKDMSTTDETLPRSKRRSPRVEVKNLNSIRQVREAVEYEALRQAQLWLDNESASLETAKQIETNRGASTVPANQLIPSAAETRTWNPSARATELIRRKDGEEDYRFLPEPDLPPMILEASSSSSHGPSMSLLDGMDVETFVQAHMPELPSQAIFRLQQSYGLTKYQATVITRDPPAIAFFDHAIAVALRGEGSGKSLVHDNKNINDKDENQIQETSADAHTSRVATMTANLMINNLMALIKDYSTTGGRGTSTSSSSSSSATEEEWMDATASVQDSEVSSEQLGQTVALVLDGTISVFMAQTMLRILYTEEKGGIPAQVAEARGWKLLSDPDELKELCRRIVVVEESGDKLQQYVTGGTKAQTKLLRYYSGRVMAACKGNANPDIMRDMLEEVLQEQCQKSSGTTTNNPNEIN